MDDWKLRGRVFVNLEKKPNVFVSFNQSIIYLKDDDIGTRRIYRNLNRGVTVILTQAVSVFTYYSS